MWGQLPWSPAHCEGLLRDLSLQVIKEASTAGTNGMEVPMSPVMPCKMDLDKVMFSGCG